MIKKEIRVHSCSFVAKILFLHCRLKTFRSINCFSGFRARAETIANTDHRFNAAAAVPQFLSQAADVDVERAGLAVIFQPPDLVEQLFARRHSSLVAREDGEQRELLAGQLDAPPLAGDRKIGVIDPELAVVIKLRRPLFVPRTAQSGSHARDKLAHAEGLSDVIVGAEVQAADFMSLLDSRREHNDRRAPCLFFGAKAAAQLESAHPGQIQVEYDQIRSRTGQVARPPRMAALAALARLFLPLAERYVQPHFSGERDLSDERAVAFEVVANALGYVGIVFDDEYKGFHIRLRIAEISHRATERRRRRGRERAGRKKKRLSIRAISTFLLLSFSVSLCLCV